MAAITAPDVLSLLRRVEQRGAIETVHRAQQNCGQVSRYAVATGGAASDPSRDLRGALTPWKPQHYSTLTNSQAVADLLRDIDAYAGTLFTKCSLRLSPLLFVRPGELRGAEWAEIGGNRPQAARVADSRCQDEASNHACRALGVPGGEGLRRAPAPYRERSPGIAGSPKQWLADEREHRQRSAASSGVRARNADRPWLPQHGLDDAS